MARIRCGSNTAPRILRVSGSRKQQAGEPQVLPPPAAGGGTAYVLTPAAGGGAAGAPTLVTGEGAVRRAPCRFAAVAAASAGAGGAQKYSHVCVKVSHLIVPYAPLHA